MELIFLQSYFFFSTLAMPLKMIVKVGKITNLSDARYCAGMNVDLLGFITVQTQENYLPPTAYQDIRGWLSGPQMVAEIYGLPNAAALNDILEEYKPDYLELSKQELPLVGQDVPLLLRWEASLDHEQLKKLNLYGLIVSPEQVNQVPADMGDVKLLVETEALDQVLNKLHDQVVDGIVLNGTSEESPGLKDYDHLSSILESLEVE